MAAEAVYLHVAVPLPVHALYTYVHEVALAPGTPVVVPYGRRELVGWVIDQTGPPPQAREGNPPDPGRHPRVHR